VRVIDFLFDGYTSRTLRAIAYALKKLLPGERKAIHQRLKGIAEKFGEHIYIYPLLFLHCLSFNNGCSKFSLHSFYAKKKKLLQRWILT